MTLLAFLAHFQLCQLRQLCQIFFSMSVVSDAIRLKILHDHFDHLDKLSFNSINS